MRFDRAALIVKRHEGGLVDDPNDPGGITNMGVSLRAYPKLGAEGIRNLTVDQWREIMRRDFYDPVKGDELPWPLAICVFDAAVMSGVRRASRWLQMILETTVDGFIGHNTINAAFDADQGRAVHAYSDLRLSFLRSLNEWERFGEGWTNRVYDTLREALA